MVASALAAVAALCAAVAQAPGDPHRAAGERGGPADAGAVGVAAPSADAELSRMAAHETWVRRLVAAMRLERKDTPRQAERLLDLCLDPDPRVRSAAVLAMRNVGAPESGRLAAAERDPRVIRTMLRCGWKVDPDRIVNGARLLAKSDVPSDRLLAVELVGALEARGLADARSVEFGKDTLKSVIARLDKESGGALSPRIASITGAPDVRVDWRWRSWVDRNRLGLRIDRGMHDAPGPWALPNAVAALEDPKFVAFAKALDDAFPKPIDLAVAIDCTASMSGELRSAQAGIDDLMTFVNGVSAGMRVAVVGYRDRREEFTVKPWDFTPDPAVARARLWQLSAAGGGDEPELVYEALKAAYGTFSWRPDSQRVLVLVGDAPPHPGFGTPSEDLARAAHRAGIVTHVLSARPSSAEEEVKHFAEIARAGGGTVTRLDARGELAAQLAGLVLSDTWRDQVVAVFERHLMTGR
jgi:hypothetical protein